MSKSCRPLCRSIAIKAVTFFRCALLSFILVIFLPGQSCFADNEISVSLTDADITIEHFPADGPYLLLWLAPEYGLRPPHRNLSARLARENIEVWLTDISESLFLPQSTQSLKQLDGHYIAQLIQYAHKTTGKKIILAGDSYAAISVLRGAHQWQQSKPASPYLIGAVLFSPYAYAFIPPLGQTPEYVPVVTASNIPMMIYQTTKSGNFGQFTTLMEKLQSHDSPVYTKLLPDLMGLFYRETPDIANHPGVKTLARNISKMIRVLEKHPLPLKAIPLDGFTIKDSGIDIALKEYTGSKAPLNINLHNVHGRIIHKDNYKGQVTVVNFWATWCPPCVEEIPSLNRLKMKMAGQPFELISINYAEDKQTIIDFMQKINIDFPVLLDPDGKFAKQWNVVTYPSTFIIDKQGKIRYGVNAAIEWDAPEVIEKIKLLF